MENLNVVSKGAYGFPQNDPGLTIENFIFVTEDNKKFLLLNWRNRRGEALTGLRLRATFFDAAGNIIGKRNLSFEHLQCGADASFVLEPKIEVSKNCVDFKIDLNAAQYGNFTYSADQDGVRADYHSDAPPENAGSFAAGKRPAKESFDIALRKPRLPFWIGVVFCVLLACLIAFASWQLVDFKARSNSFLKDGVEYTFVYNGDSGRNELYVTGLNENKRHITIPESIGDYPVTRIGDRAFWQNSYVQSVTLKGSLSIGNDVFYACTYLTSINLDKVTSIGADAFSCCTSLTDVAAYQLGEIGVRAFSQCQRLQTVKIENPQKTIVLGAQAFSNCESLTSVAINQSITYPYVPDIFSYSGSIETLELKTFPMSDDGGQYVSINSLSGGPYLQSSLRNVKIGSMNQIVNDFAHGYSMLERVEIGHVAAPVIGDSAFRDCYSLGYLALPEIEEIGANAFENCQSLQTFPLSQNLRSIGFAAFSNCRALSSVVIPARVKTIEPYAFAFCESLTELSVPFLGNYADSQSGLLINIFGDYIPYSLRSVTVTGPIDAVGDCAFNGGYAIEKIVLPDTVVSVGAYAFADCRSLSAFRLPANVTSIGEGAFYNCIALTQIALPSDLSDVGVNAFENCYRLYEVRNESTLDLSVDPSSVGQVTKFALKVYSAGESFAARVRKDGFSFARIENVWYMLGYPRNYAYVALPQSFEAGETVRSYRVPNYLFSEEEELQFVTVPPSVEDIGNFAFQHCTNLTSVEFVGDSALSVLREGIFEYCISLTELTLPARLARIEAVAFLGCRSITRIVLPRTLSEIGENAFKECINLRTVYNLSGLPLIKGGENYGYAAYYAEKVYTSLEEEELSKLTRLGYGVNYVEI